MQLITVKLFSKLIFSRENFFVVKRVHDINPQYHFQGKISALRWKSNQDMSPTFP